MTLLDEPGATRADDVDFPLCAKGLHPLTPENTWGDDNGRCRECHRIWNRERTRRLGLVSRGLRYPFAPVETLVGTDDVGELAARFGVKCSTVHYWRERGMAEKTADRVAVALGLTPHLIRGWEHYEEGLCE